MPAITITTARIQFTTTEHQPIEQTQRLLPQNYFQIAICMSFFFQLSVLTNVVMITLDCTTSDTWNGMANNRNIKSHEATSFIVTNEFLNYCQHWANMKFHKNRNASVMTYLPTIRQHALPPRIGLTRRFFFFWSRDMAQNYST